MERTPLALGVIPARGGSKRLPRKNIRPLLGKPMLAYTIEAAANAGMLTHFLVSTEDEEIAAVAREHGAPVPFIRPPELATDTVRNIDVVLHALEFMERGHGLTYDMVVLLQPTSPIRDPRHIDQAVRELAASPLDTLAAVKGPFAKRDPYVKRIQDGELLNYCGEGQNNDPFYMYNAALYAAKREHLVTNRKLVSHRSAPLVMDAYHSLDVDTLADFLVAEVYLRHVAEQRAKGQGDDA